MFWFGGKLMESNKEIKPDAIFISMFAIMFGAQQMGQAASMGPDIGKATAAATKVFKIMEYPSRIDAIAIE